MTASDVEWISGACELRELVDRELTADFPGATLLAESARRRVIAMPASQRSTDGDRLVVKHLRAPEKLPLGHALKQRMGMGPALREWRNLRRLASRGVQVPKVLGIARCANGDWLLVLARLEGQMLSSALDDAACDPHALLGAVGEAIRELHRTGTAHGDLHIGNVFVSTAGPVLLDFAAAHRALPGDAIKDIGSLDFSLAHHSLPDSLRESFWRAGLDESGTSRPKAFKGVERSSRAHGRNFYRSRGRRSLRPGRLYARANVGDLRGMRSEDFPQHALESAVAAHRKAVASGGSAVLKCDHRSRVSSVVCDGRSVIVKEVTKGGLVKGFADHFRGSPARRAWLAGVGLRTRKIQAARPLAFLEPSGRVSSNRSLLVLEDVRPAQPACAFLCSDREDDHASAIEALCTLAIQLHRGQVVHGDLQSHHIYLRRCDDGIQATLIDLEGVRFPATLSDAKRIRALAELNASLPDDLVSGEERARAFRRYIAALPFQGSAREALQEIVSQSRARAHFWTGADCDPGEKDLLSSAEQ